MNTKPFLTMNLHTHTERCNHAVGLDREYVEAAIAATKRIPNGKWRCRMIEMVYFRQTHTLAGAAYACHISYGTARDWNGDFIRLVADQLHLS